MDCLVLNHSDTKVSSFSDHSGPSVDGGITSDIVLNQNECAACAPIEIFA